jgi:hypothetical protein
MASVMRADAAVARESSYVCSMAINDDDGKVLFFR